MLSTAVAGHGMTTCKGRPAVAKAPLQRRGRLRLGPARKGWLAATRANPHRSQGLPPIRAVAHGGSAYRGDARGGADRRGGHPLTGWLPTGKGNRCLRKGGDDGDTMRVRKEG
ncbi:hypothetical protein B296_00039242 [Ensete ventricosum]|uniref:Uncharacterized protein n=1 Tax=Ensete ventricosum TaxID=4639 RepID=A0A426YN00_ENSVE|nr:hypothetical protein B296_00039242 [Ensete ventricosum]